MFRTLRRLALAGLVIVPVAILTTSVTLAAAPTRTEEEVHISTTFAAGARCAFEVVRTIDGTLVTTTFTGSDGLTKTTFSYKDGKIGYLNPANGNTLQAVLAGPAIYVDNGDGTTTLRIPGNSQQYTAPGIGFIAVQSRTQGHVVIGAFGHRLLQEGTVSGVDPRCHLPVSAVV